MFNKVNNAPIIKADYLSHYKMGKADAPIIMMAEKYAEMILES